MCCQTLLVLIFIVSQLAQHMARKRIHNNLLGIKYKNLFTVNEKDINKNATRARRQMLISYNYMRLSSQNDSASLVEVTQSPSTIAFCGVMSQLYNKSTKNQAS